MTAPMGVTSQSADTPAIVKFLKEGGLTSILRTNLGGGHPPPRIHFAHSRSGGVTYTFQGPPELIRGTPPVPFLALHDGKKVFTPKKEEVVDYLTQLGLSKAEAEDVIRAVGTAP